MQSAYEDQLAAARLQLDQAAAGQTLDQDDVKGQIEKLVLRATMLEMRAAAVAEIVERVPHESARDVASTEVKASPGAPAKPETEEWDLRLGDAAPAPGATRAESAPTKAADADLAPEARLVPLALSLDRIEREQILRTRGRRAAGDRRREPAEARLRHGRPLRRPHLREGSRAQGGAGGRGTFDPRR